MQYNYTEAARRAFLRARQISSAGERPHVEPLHLLAALLMEESRGSEMATGAGLTIETIKRQISIPQHIAEPQQTEDVHLQSFGDKFVHQVLAEAHRIATDLLGRAPEIGTEHLLYGLSCVDSAAGKMLDQSGLTTEQITIGLQTTTEQHQIGEPLATDFEIDWGLRGGTEHADFLRIVDAAVNRTREGLRVIEDYVRFVLDDATHSAALKQLRHQLTTALDHPALQSMLRTRETEFDVGTSLTTTSEQQRHSLQHVVTANFKRVQEALRTLEEYSKLVAPQVGQQIEQVRYAAYTLEKNICATWENRALLKEKSLYLLLTRALCKRSAVTVLEHAMSGGVNIVQIREKDLSDRELVTYARNMRELTRERNVLLIINDRPDIAALVDADGVHVGQEELSVKDARRIVGTSRLVGVSTHSIEQARQAVREGADYLGVGPCFPSQTKNFDTFAGLEFVQQVAKEITLPWFAIGGINAENLPALQQAGATRVAISHAICGMEDPGKGTGELKRLLES